MNIKWLMESKRKSKWMEKQCNRSHKMIAKKKKQKNELRRMLGDMYERAAKRLEI